jgi:two-component system, NarL family, nitrate/nitrite response regulator NarL
MMPGLPIRVGIIEDHAVVRAGLKMLLESQRDIEVVGEAVDRRTAFDIAERAQPDIFLVDILLGRESAVDFLKELLNVSGASAILLTAMATEDHIQRAIQAGATGLVYKEEAAEVLLRAIRKVHGGEAWLSRSVMTSALSELQKFHTGNPGCDAETAKIASLTTREREIVTLIASGLNRKSIAKKLFVSEATIRNHRSSIFGKLGVSNQFELVFYAQRHGLHKSPTSPK